VERRPEKPRRYKDKIPKSGMSKYIPLGLHCCVTFALEEAGLREYLYPFDSHWTPSQTTYSILKILLTSGVEAAIVYMVTEYKYYVQSEYTEEFYLVDYKTNIQINPATGLAIVHHTINEEFSAKLRRRLTRLLADIKSDKEIKFIYCDTTAPFYNYIIDGVEYGVDATPYLEKIYDLIYQHNPNIEIIYFCWPKRERISDKITYRKFTTVGINGLEARANLIDIIKKYLLTYTNKI
jgi:hypothetical protein